LKNEGWESPKTDEEREVEKDTPQKNPEIEFHRPVATLGEKIP
jgi:hypothetical protein